MTDPQHIKVREQADATIMLWLGVWSGATPYVANDVVINTGIVYVCILAHTNEEPPNITYWEVLGGGGGGASVANIGSTAETVGGSVDNGAAATASRSDHKHAITALKLDDAAAPDDNTDLDASTTLHGLLLKAVAPASGLLNVLGTVFGDTLWAIKTLFDNTNPAALGSVGPGTQVVAARRDHVHPMPSKTDVGLSSVDNVQQMPLSYLDTDAALAANSNTKVPSQAAVKAYAAAVVAASGVVWSIITADQTAVIGHGYVCNKGTLLLLTLPVTSIVGSIVRVAGMNAGLWKIVQGAGQQIHFGNQDTTSGATGYLASGLTRDAVELVCVVANNEWNVVSSIGNMAVA